MKDRLKQTLSHPLISGSVIIFLGTNLGNVFNFLFNIFMLHNLTPVDYGVLISLISIITLFSQVADSATPFVVNFAAQFFAKNELGKAKSLFLKVTKGAALIGAFFFVLFVVFAGQVSTFLHIKDRILIDILALSILFGFIGIVNRAFLQAKLSFTFLAIIVFFGAVLKFFSGIYLVMKGMRVEGALIAFVIAFFIPYIMSFIPLRGIFRKHVIREHLELRKMLGFGFGAALAIFSLTALTTTDVLLVKHFFNPQLAGLYAGLTIVGKIIFFFSAPIGSVMFPIIVRKYANKENFHGDFRLATALVLLPSILLTAIYFVFPEFSITFIMKRSEYLAGIPYLGYVGIFYTFYSLLYVITSFFLSIQKIHIYVPILIAALLQAFLLSIFHQSLMQVYLISMLTSGLLLLTLLLYYVRISSVKVAPARIVK